MMDELDTAFKRVISTSRFILGDETLAFERDFAQYCGTEFAIGCGNGTDALEMTLAAMNVGPGDEVVTVSHTFVATAEAVVRCGATPCFVDVRPLDLLLNTDDLESAISPRTKAIIAVHLYGACVAMPVVLDVAARHGIQVVEDAAQAHGARLHGRCAGSWGHAATFSFYPGKNLGALGDAGAIVTSDESLANRVRMIRDHGRVDKYRHELIGRNSRMDGIQAAVLGAKLKRLDDWNARRREIAEKYRRAFEELPGIEPVRTAPGSDAVHHLFVVQVDRRDRWRQGLANRAIATGIHYPIPVHLQPAFHQGEDSAPRPPLPVTEQAANRVLSLPIFAEMTEQQVERVIAAVSEVALEIQQTVT